MSLFGKLRRDKRGISAALLGIIVALIFVAVALPVGMLTTSQLYTTVSTLNLGTSGNSTRTTLFNNIWSSYSLMAITPIIVAAGVIIAIVVGSFAFGAARKGGY